MFFVTGFLLDYCNQYIKLIYYFNHEFIVHLFTNMPSPFIVALTCDLRTTNCGEDFVTVIAAKANEIVIEADTRMYECKETINSMFEPNCDSMSHAQIAVLREGQSEMVKICQKVIQQKERALSSEIDAPLLAAIVMVCDRLVEYIETTHTYSTLGIYSPYPPDQTVVPTQ